MFEERVFRRVDRRWTVEKPCSVDGVETDCEKGWCEGGQRTFWELRARRLRREKAGGGSLPGEGSCWDSHRSVFLCRWQGAAASQPARQKFLSLMDSQVYGKDRVGRANASQAKSVGVLGSSPPPGGGM